MDGLCRAAGRQPGGGRPAVRLCGRVNALWIAMGIVEWGMGNGEGNENSRLPLPLGEGWGEGAVFCLLLSSFCLSPCATGSASASYLLPLLGERAGVRGCLVLPSAFCFPPSPNSVAAHFAFALPTSPPTPLNDLHLHFVAILSHRKGSHFFCDTIAEFCRSRIRNPPRISR